MCINRKILLVDDDESTVRGYQKILKYHFDVHTAISGMEGLEIIKATPDFAVIISDYRMPEMNGIEFLSKVKEINPNIVRIIFSGNADFRIAIEAVNEGNIFRFLTKPIDNDKLVKAIQDGTEQYRLLTSEQNLLRELHSVNQRVQTLLRHSPVILFSFDKDGRLSMLEGRDIERNLAEYKEELHHHYKDIFANYPEFVESIEACFNGRSLINNLRIKGYYFEISMTPIFGKDDKIDGVFGIATDVSKQKIAEHRILRDNTRLQSLIDNLGSGILIENEKREILYINREFVDLFAIPADPSQLLGANCENSAEESKHLFNHEKEFVDRINQILEKKKVVKGEMLELKDGRFFERDFVPFYYGKEYFGHLWQYRDITKHKKVQAMLKIRERAIQSSTQGIVICDAQTPDTPVVFVNPAFEIITGYKSNEVMGKNLRLLHKGDSDQEALQKIREAIESRVSTKQVLRNYKKDGSLFWNELNISPVFNELGVVTHFVGIENDISSRIKADNLLKQSNERLNEAYQRLKNDLEAAAKLQRSLLPDIQKIEQLDFKWFFEPSVFLSGDIFNYFKINNRYIAFYIIDVAGHGIPSALISVTLSRILTPDYFVKGNIADIPQQIKKPAEIISELNERFCSPDDAMEYFTMILGYFDTKESKITFCQAGHPKMLMIRDGKIKQFGGPSFPVAMLEEAEYEDTLIDLMPNDKIIVFSDGVTECENIDGQFFGEENLINYINDNVELSSEKLLEQIENKLKNWRSPKEFEDDVTFISVDIDIKT